MHERRLFAEALLAPGPRTPSPQAGGRARQRRMAARDLEPGVGRHRRTPAKGHRPTRPGGLRGFAKRRHRTRRQWSVPTLHEPYRDAKLDRRSLLLRWQHRCHQSLCLRLVSARRHFQYQVHCANRPRPTSAQLDHGVQGHPHGSGERCQAHRHRSAQERER